MSIDSQQSHIKTRFVDGTERRIAHRIVINSARTGFRSCKQCNQQKSTLLQSRPVGSDHVVCFHQKPQDIVLLSSKNRTLPQDRSRFLAPASRSHLPPQIYVFNAENGINGAGFSGLIPSVFSNHATLYH